MGVVRSPFRWAFGCGGVAFMLIVSMVLIGGPARSPYDAGRVVGAALVATMIPALLTGVLARTNKTGWSARKLVLVYLCLLVALALLRKLGAGH